MEKYDLIFWNMPYIKINEFDNHLGPMEEAALIDTSSKSLVSLTLMQINTSKILKIRSRFADQLENTSIMMPYSENVPSMVSQVESLMS